MANVTLIDPVRDPRWDKFVEKHPFGWITHLSGWKEVLENSFPHMKGYYLALLDNEKDDIKAAFPLFEVKSWLTGKRLVSLPFATLCDPLISTHDDMEELLDAAINLSKELRTTYIEVRTFRSAPLIYNDRLANHNFYKHHYLSLEREPEELKKSFHRTCIRKRIQRALNSNLNLKVGNNKSDLLCFYQLYVQTRKRLCLPPVPYRFFEQLWEIFYPAKKITLLLAEQKEKKIAGLMLFRFNNMFSAEFLTSDHTFREVSPDHFLYWEAINLAYSEGFKIFSFGRTSSFNKTLMDFKNRWGTTIIDLPQFYYPREKNKRLECREKSIGYRIIKKICRKAPDSTIRYIGDFCYRHLS
jgi:hypothetical protein